MKQASPSATDQPQFNGGDGDDLVNGGAGNDRVTGNNGNDRLFGLDGNDTMAGGDGVDRMNGGAGNDFLNGGGGRDYLVGGGGADRFYHSGLAADGTDYIQDFRDAQNDRLVFGAAARASDFDVSFATLRNVGRAGVEDAVVTYKPTGDVLFVLVDAEYQDAIDMAAGGRVFDLL